MKKISAVLLLSCAGALFSACGGFTSDYCALACECENCSDNKYDECELSIDGESEVASVYGCDDELSRVQDCVLEYNTCEAAGESGNRRLRSGPECGDLDVELNECVSRASALDDRDQQP